MSSVSRHRAGVKATVPAVEEPMQGVGGRHLPEPAPEEQVHGVRGGGHLPAPAPEEQVQGVRGREHLSAPAREEPMLGVRGREHLPAPAHQEHMQAVRRGEHLPAPAHQEQVQGVPRRGGQVDAGWPGGARGSWRVSAAGISMVRWMGSFPVDAFRHRAA